MKDKLYSHSITNYLLASYQGRFTFLNILSQLRFPGIDPTEIARTKQALSSIKIWTAQLWQGIVIFTPEVVDLNTAETKDAIRLLENLKPELRETSEILKRLLSSSHFHENKEQLQWLIASFGRFAYGRENFIRGYLEFARVFKDEGMQEFYAPQLVSAEQDVRVANHFFETVKNIAQLPPEGFYEYLRYRTVHLPCIFASYVHDINQLSAPFRGGLKWETCDFTGEEAKAWVNLGFEAAMAGYWRAYEFIPKDALSWLQIGVLDAGMAFEWRMFGFNPIVAVAWIPAGFPPSLARGWMSKGYSPERAMEQVKAGIVDPANAPELAGTKAPSSETPPEDPTPPSKKGGAFKLKKRS